MIAPLLALALLGTTPDPRVPTVAAHIQALESRVSPARARHLSRLIVYWSDQFGLQPDLLVAILRQESDFESGQRACWEVVRHGETVTTCDYGIAQINEVWIPVWRLDPVQLQNDDSYSIGVAARVLARLKKYYGQEPDWYGRYNSAIPAKKAVYLEQLQPFLARL